MSNGRLQFFNLVKAMREAQREYFSTRSHEALQKARSLERSVDAYIKRGDDYVGCELDKEYFDKGCERFNKECKGEYLTPSGKTVKQLTLFEL